MSGPAPEVLLTMPARPEGVGVVRQALAGMADALDFDPTVLADMKMAVTEACTNVVVHAYDEDAGMLEVEMLADENGLTIVVRDHGAGIQPRPARSEPPALGLGLPLIAALTDAFELKGSAGQGTEVRMTFAYSRGSIRPRRTRSPGTSAPTGAGTRTPTHPPKQHSRLGRRGAGPLGPRRGQFGRCLGRAPDVAKRALAQASERWTDEMVAGATLASGDRASRNPQLRAPPDAGSRDERAAQRHVRYRARPNRPPIATNVALAGTNVALAPPGESQRGCGRRGAPPLSSTPPGAAPRCRAVAWSRAGGRPRGSAPASF